MRKIIMHNAKFIIGIVAMSLLSSCGLYKKYERPTDVEVKGIMRGAETADSLTFGDVAWREVLQTHSFRHLYSRVWTIMMIYLLQQPMSRNWRLH